MKIEFMWKDDGSGGGGCPALHRAPGGYVVVGKKVDAETRAQVLQLADDEDVIYVPANVLDKLRDLT